MGHCGPVAATESPLKSLWFLQSQKAHAGYITVSQQKANKQADRINRLYSLVFSEKSMIFSSNAHHFVSKSVCTRASFVSQA